MDLCQVLCHGVAAAESLKKSDKDRLLNELRNDASYQGVVGLKAVDKVSLQRLPFSSRVRQRQKHPG